MALQNLGSSKHQGELHYLALLIIFHRLRTLDVDAIDPYVDTAHFDSTRFFIENSRPLTFEDIDAWELGPTARALATLAAARSWDDLLVLKSAPSRLGLFPQRDTALRTLFERILTAVWTISSLGTPMGVARNNCLISTFEWSTVDAWISRPYAQSTGAWLRH